MEKQGFPILHLAGVQRAAALCQGAGCPRKNLFSSLLRAAAGGKETGDTPDPGRETPAPL
ncbi:hypothetical protein KSF_016350 [Reticulibacter mediterranei]|uniref:Uncharacterized protein n=1 Tax=Reticulibacter mediterranei TaxID=2778369 RepID=A0A8J3IHJ4_9CHLR|nr:hypothetical protein KSF_016350 [Reticulibacter mediterranei]